MVGYRKLVLGCVFILSSSFLIWQGIRAGVDLLQLSTPIGAMAGGLFGVVWGNVKENKGKNEIIG